MVISAHITITYSTHHTLHTVLIHTSHTAHSMYTQGEEIGCEQPATLITVLSEELSMIHASLTNMLSWSLHLGFLWELLHMDVAMWNALTREQLVDRNAIIWGGSATGVVEWTETCWAWKEKKDEVYPSFFSFHPSSVIKTIHLSKHLSTTSRPKGFR